MANPVIPITTTVSRRLAQFAGASAVGLALAATPALAQSYGYDDAPQQTMYGPSDNVEVIAPRPRPEQRSEIGAPIVNVALSQPVRYDDLDLRSRRGAHELRERVRATARKLCNRLDFEYPVTVSGTPPCYRTTAQQALYRADLAIRDARYEQDSRGYDRDMDAPDAD